MLKKIKDLIFNIVYFLVLIYLIIFVPKLWGENPLVVISGSMEPTLKVGSILYYHKQDIDDFNKGDILVYKTKKHIISHRIVERIENSFITQGDANNIYDSRLVEKKQILGKGTNWCIPFIGYYADYIYNHKYLLYISIGIIALDLSNDFYQTHKKKRKKCDEKIE